MTTTYKPKLSRRTWIVLVVASALIVSALSIVLVNVTASPAAVPYRVSANGNLHAIWTSDSNVGQLDMSSGSDVQTVTARSVSVSVDSTLPGGASCRIEGPNGETYVDHAPANGSMIVTATCSTK